MEEQRMKRWIAKAAAFALVAGVLGSAMPVAAEPTYACTLEREGEMFQVAYDHPYDPGSLYQCRGAAWRLVGLCTFHRAMRIEAGPRHGPRFSRSKAQP
jgi:hypothetical protein